MWNLGKTTYYEYVRKICFLMDRQRQLSISFCLGTYSGSFTWHSPNTKVSFQCRPGEELCI